MFYQADNIQILQYNGNKRNTILKRDIYLDKLKIFKDKDLIKAITGAAKCGKSTLFDLYIDYLITINFTLYISHNGIKQINVLDQL